MFDLIDDVLGFLSMFDWITATLGLLGLLRGDKGVVIPGDYMTTIQDSLRRQGVKVKKPALTWPDDKFVFNVAAGDWATTRSVLASYGLIDDEKTDRDRPGLFDWL